MTARRPTPLAWIAGTLVGALILWRRANPVGAILLGFGLLGATLGASQSYGAYVGVIPPSSNDPWALSAIAATGWRSVIGAFAWLAGVTLILLLIQLFPDGRPRRNSLHESGSTPILQTIARDAMQVFWVFGVVPDARPPWNSLENVRRCANCDARCSG